MLTRYKVIFEKAEKCPFLVWLSAVTEDPGIERRPSPLIGTVTQGQKIISGKDTGMLAAFGSVRVNVYRKEMLRPFPCLNPTHRTAFIYFVMAFLFRPVCLEPTIFLIKRDVVEGRIYCRNKKGEGLAHATRREILLDITPLPTKAEVLVGGEQKSDFSYNHMESSALVPAGCLRSWKAAGEWGDKLLSGSSGRAGIASALMCPTLTWAPGIWIHLLFSHLHGECFTHWTIFRVSKAWILLKIINSFQTQRRSASWAGESPWTFRRRTGDSGHFGVSQQVKGRWEHSVSFVVSKSRQRGMWVMTERDISDGRNLEHG